jgi:sugar-specific transcriptional regulator TrmB
MPGADTRTNGLPAWYIEFIAILLSKFNATGTVSQERILAWVVAKVYLLEYNLKLMQLATVFDRLGMPAHSAAVFELLEKKELSASEIVRICRLHRPAVYKVLAALSKKGLIKKTGSRTRPLYTAAARSAVTALFAADLKSLERLENRVPVPYETPVPVTYYEGKRGIAAVFDDAIIHSKKGETFYRYTSEVELDEVNRYLSPDYRKKRDAKRLERLVISNRESGQKKRPRLERFVKYLGSGKEPFLHNAIQLVYGDRLAFIDLNVLQSFVIENKTLAEFQKTIFRALYKRL